MLDNLYLIILFPLVGFLLNGLFGKFFSKKLVGLIACGSVFLSFVGSVISFGLLIQLPVEARQITNTLFTWLDVGSLEVTASLMLDPLSAVMILVVTGVGFLIHVYSIGYMHDDPGYARYFAYLNLFTFSMLLLVTAANLPVLFIGWEGVGLCSYLLIGFWYEKKSASDAGKKAFIVNRIGDFGFLLGMFLLFVSVGTLDFASLQNPDTDILVYGGGLITAITLLFFVGATGKSAQIPLYVWLPDAMEGPTPVSALIHAATMVTAGVYMVVRLSALFILAPTTMMIVAIIGAATAFYAATIALCQHDIKRVLAYSTISQLGYMFLACGVGAFAAGIFHLTTHAFFKALLFLGAGSVMHALAGEQDMQKMGALKPHIPKTFWTMLIATMAIAGIPGLSGFFSKDEILWKAFSSSQGSWLLWLIGAGAAMLTAFYMFRLVFLTFFGESRVEPQVAEHIHESPPIMSIPLILLAILSVIGGYVGVPTVLGGSNRIERFLEPAIAHLPAAGKEGSPSHVLELTLMLVSVAIAAVGIALAYEFYIKDKRWPERVAVGAGRLYKTVYNKYYVDEIYDFAVVRIVMAWALALWKGFDGVLIEGLVNGSAKVTLAMGRGLRRIETGYVRNYALGLLAGAVILMALYMMSR